MEHGLFLLSLTVINWGQIWKVLPPCLNGWARQNLHMENKQILQCAVMPLPDSSGLQAVAPPQHSTAH